MLRSMRGIFGYKIQAKDGELGKVDDFFFDDVLWVVRYLVVKTGGWLSGRKVLIIPSDFKDPNWESQTMFVDLTKEQIEKSPEIDFDKPVSRQKEKELYRYYRWSPYWTGDVSGIAPVPPVPPPVPSEIEEKKKEKEEEDTHLRSSKEVTGYRIQATDGEIGHVDDFIVDDLVWVIRYLVVDTRKWLPGRKVLVAPDWITEVSWPEEKVYVDQNKDLIEKSPEYDPYESINRKYETRLYDFYGRPKYWD